MKIRKLERNGWEIGCPSCGERIRYSLIHNQGLPVPFFYAERCNDVLLRRSDEISVNNLLSAPCGEKISLDALEKLWLSILHDAPDAPHGGRFGFWSNIKCPNCGKEVPYNHGVKNIELRIFEPRIVLVDGAILVGDSSTDTWQVHIQVVTPTSQET